MLPEISTELDRAIAEVKRQQGRDTMRADELAPLLPVHLRQPFWRQAIEHYLRGQLGDETYEEVTGGGSA